jgi:hypothetical protein
MAARNMAWRRGKWHGGAGDRSEARHPDRADARRDRRETAPWIDADTYRLCAGGCVRESCVPLATIEVRWFFEGALEDTGRGVAAWFEAKAPPSRGQPAPMAWDPRSPAWRQDRYLLIPGHDDMGIKWREGRLEIKGREADLGTRVFAPAIEGRCERWLKWSYAGDRIAARIRPLFQGEGDAAATLLVEKRRRRRLLRVDDQGETMAVAPDEPRRRGVDVELTRIGLPARGEEHWSLAFEAFPGDRDMAAALVPIVARFLEDYPALPLAEDRSMGYPRWLVRSEDATGATT